MDSISVLIAFAISMWILQIFLGWRQIKLFNQAFFEISAKGKVKVGRNSGRFRPKTVIVLAVDEQQNVIDSFYMKGLSVFVKPKPLDALKGLNICQIIPESIFPNDKYAQEALQVALKH